MTAASLTAKFIGVVVTALLSAQPSRSPSCCC